MISGASDTATKYSFGRFQKRANRPMCSSRVQTRFGRLPLANRNGRRELITGTSAALIFGFLVSWAAAYGLNQYLGLADPETTGTVRISHPPD